MQEKTQQETAFIATLEKLKAENEKIIEEQAAELKKNTELIEKLRKENLTLKRQRIIFVSLFILCFLILIFSSMSYAADKNDMQLTISRLLNDLTVANDELDSYKIDSDEMSNTITKINNDNSRLENVVDVTQKDLDNLNNLIEEYKDNISWMQEKIDNYENANSSLRKDLSEKDKSINALQKELKLYKYR